MDMTKQFITDQFLLNSSLAVDLYKQVAKALPIIDFHNHLNPAFLAEDKTYNNITELWVTPDQYKHRAMRICGVPEAEITGKVADELKFKHWAKTLPKTIGNPLYHWSALELHTIFDIDVLLSEDTADEIWHRCNERLSDPEFSHNSILRRWNIESLTTSDDPLDDVSLHQKAPKELGVKPSLRPDTALAFEMESWKHWKENLILSSGIDFKNLEAYKAAIIKRIDAFERGGCIMADHALDAGFTFRPTTNSKADKFFSKVMDGEPLSADELISLKSNMLEFFGHEYGRRNWVMQLHIGAQRNTSSRLRKLAGAAGGYACIGSSCNISDLVAFLDKLEKNRLPKTILYTLNPADYEALASVTGSFSEDGVEGKVQLGPPWWYNDHLFGIEQHYRVLSSYGLISTFIGMTTDSRSILSFSRHDYFRRVMCNLISKDVEKGLMPEDEKVLTSLVRGVCYHNIKNWLS